MIYLALLFPDEFYDGKQAGYCPWWRSWVANYGLNLFFSFYYLKMFSDAGDMP